jgi:tripartite-type tricarboxylate transporter receptor subunit TctC
MKLTLAVLAAWMLALAAGAQAAASADANFPVRPNRLIVPQAPGGSNDIMARYIGGQLAERFGQQVVIDNRPGAEGMIGTEMVARANPDGYTLLMASAAFTMNPAVRKLPYDPIKDFDWVAMLGNGAVAVVVGPSMPVNSLQELVTLGKSRPGYLTAGAAGGFNHFVAALFKSLAGIDMVIALYRGGAPALIDVMGGQIHVGVPTLVTAFPLIRSGKLKVLAAGGLKRTAVMPETPSISEAGVAGYDAAIWWAFATTAGVPAAVINRMNAEVAAILNRPETVKRFAAEGGEIDVRTPAEIRKMIPHDLAKWAKVARDAGMEMQK